MQRAEDGSVKEQQLPFLQQSMLGMQQVLPDPPLLPMPSVLTESRNYFCKYLAA